VKEIVTQLVSIGKVALDQRIMHIVLGGLPNYLESFVQVITTQDELPSFDKLASKLLLQEQWHDAFNEKGVYNETLYMQANNKAFRGGQNRDWNQCKETGDDFFNTKYQGGHGGRGRRHGEYHSQWRQCNNYGEQGHWLCECLQPLQEIPKFEKNEMANTVKEIKTNEEIDANNKSLEVFKAIVLALDLNKDNDTNWYLDSRASTHVTRDSTHFSKLRQK